MSEEITVRKDGTPVAHPKELRIQALTRAAFIGPLAASRELGISYHTIKDWCYRAKREDYEEIRERELAARKQFEIEQNMEAAAERRRLANKAAIKLEEKIEDVELRDLPNAIRNLDTGAGIYTDKAQRAMEEGRPVMHVTADIGDIVKTLIGEGAQKEALDALMPGWETVLEGDAEELSDDG